MRTEKPDCQFYREGRRVIESREGQPDRMKKMPQVLPEPYCLHKHSPQTQATARQLLMPVSALKCGGMMERCTLSEEQLLDV
jgi:hypothetical protein